jgi:hypothetical protein
MADRFSQALLDRSRAPYRGGTDETRPRDDGPDAAPAAGGSADCAAGSDHETSEESGGDHPTLTATGDWPTVGPGKRAGSSAADRHDERNGSTTGAGGDETTGPSVGDRRGEPDGSSSTPGADEQPRKTSGTGQQQVTVGEDGVREGRPIDLADPTGEDPSADDRTTGPADDDLTRIPLGTREALVADLGDRVDALDPTVTAVLRHVRREGPIAPVEAHVEAGGNADREIAYSRMRRLRRAGLVEHVGRGEYAYALPALVRAEHDDHLHESDLADVVRAVEERFVDDPVHGWTLREVDETSTPDAAVTDPDVEIVASENDDALAPAFREEDAEYVDEGEIVADETVASDDEAPASDATDGETGALAAEGPTSGGADPRDGHDAEFVD